MAKARLTVGSLSASACSFGSSSMGARQGDGRRRILRHHFAQLVDLAIGHLQDAADVAQHTARLQRAEGDDLRHLVAAVAALHIVNDFVAAVLAEVDVEIRHRHAFGIEEALEQETEADRIEIGDAQRVGHERTRARAAAGTDRDTLLFRPGDEVGNDQEVARIFHLGDNAELECQPLAVFVHGVAFGDAGAGEPPLQSCLRALAQFVGLVDDAAALADRKARQDRRPRARAEGATFRDLDGGGQRFRQIGEQFAHLGAGLEAVLGVELAAVGLGDEAALGDADQRVVGLVVGDGGEIRLVGRDQRDVLGISEIDQHRLGHALVGSAVALQFDIKPVAEQADERIQPRGGELALAGGDGKIERAAGAAGERDDAFGFTREPFDLEPRRLIAGRLEEGARIQPHQAAVAGLARGQQHDARTLDLGIGAAGAVVGVAEVDGERAADDRLDAGTGELLGELQRAEHVVGIGERQRGLLVGLRQLGQPRNRQRAFEQRIGRVHVEVHEIEFAHG